MTEIDTDAAGAVAAPMLFAEFLETQPPNVSQTISDVREYRNNFWFVRTPDLQLFCSSDSCNGTRFFSCQSGDQSFAEAAKDIFLRYSCRNCRKSAKIFSLNLRHDSSAAGRAIKYGELPAFGPPTPGRLISLVGPDRDAFLKGRRAEIQGLGIGAFAYYRRVVENQKNRIIDEILRVSRHLGVKAEKLKDIEDAKTQIQFTKAIDLVGTAIPPSLLINGHNPLTLLHKALSKGLHAQSDADCLALATSIRVVLQEFTERSATALKDHAELKVAITTLMNEPEDPPAVAT